MERKALIKTMATRAAVSSALAAALLAATGPAHAAELRILSAAAMKPIFTALVPDFERSSGHKLIIDYATIGATKERVLAGETADVIVGSTVTMPALAQAGRIDGASRVTICRVGVGVVVPAGNPKPPLASIEDLKRALLAAKYIVYARPVGGGAAGVHVAAVTEKLGIAEALKPKLRYGAGGDVTEVTLAQGDGAIGLTQISEIVGKPGAVYVGPLPNEVQNYTVFVAGFGAGGKPSEAAAAFVKLLQSPAGIAAITATGMEAD
jgi:molybdate transport system substrate-binding protein